jgi:hypothetical protein
MVSLAGLILVGKAEEVDLRELCRRCFRNSGSTAAGLLIVLAVWAAPGNAQSIWYTFGPSQTLAGSVDVWCISGPNNPNCGPATLSEVAGRFTFSGQPQSLGSIGLPLGCNTGTNGVIVSLAQFYDTGEPAVGYVPGNILESWTVTNIPCGYPPPLTVVNDRLNLTLQPNTPYFVVVQPMAPDTLVVWYSSPLTGYLAYINHGSGWDPESAQNAPAFTVNGTQQSALAHIAAGGGMAAADGGVWTTEIYLVNTSASQNTVHISLYNGAVNEYWPLPITSTVQGVTKTYTSPSGPYTANLNPNATWLISLAGDPNGILTYVGSAQIQSSGPITGFAVFHWIQPSGLVSEGTVPLQTQSPYSIALPYDNTEGFAMGLALSNPTPIQETITATYRDANGNYLGSHGLYLGPYGHMSGLFSNLFPMTAGQRGIIQFNSTNAAGSSAVSAIGGLAGIGLRFSPAGTFTSVSTTTLGPASQ